MHSSNLARLPAIFALQLVRTSSQSVSSELHMKYDNLHHFSQFQATISSAVQNGSLAAADLKSVWHQCLQIFYTAL